MARATLPLPFSASSHATLSFPVLLYRSRIAARDERRGRMRSCWVLERRGAMYRPMQRHVWITALCAAIAGCGGGGERGTGPGSDTGGAIDTTGQVQRATVSLAIELTTVDS